MAHGHVIGSLLRLQGGFRIPWQPVNLSAKLIARHIYGCKQSPYDGPQQNLPYTTLCLDTIDRAYGPMRPLPNWVNTNQVSRRFRRRRGSKASSDEDAEESDNDDELENENPLLVEDILDRSQEVGKLHTVDVSSLRLDAFTKSGFNLTRSKVEELIFNGQLFLNGERPSKKSEEVNKGDEIDIVKNISDANPNKVIVNRLHIVDIPSLVTNTGRSKVQIEKWNNLEIDKSSLKGFEKV